MEILARIGDPVQVMKSYAWWQVVMTLQSGSSQNDEPAPTLRPEALRKYGVGVKVSDRPIR